MCSLYHLVLSSLTTTVYEGIIILHETKTRLVWSGLVWCAKKKIQTNSVMLKTEFRRNSKQVSAQTGCAAEKNIIDDVKRRGPCRDRRNVHYNQYKRVVEISTKVGVGWSNNNNTKK